MKEMKEIEIDRIIEMAWEDRTLLKLLKFNLKYPKKTLLN